MKRNKFSLILILCTIFITISIIPIIFIVVTNNRKAYFSTAMDLPMMYIYTENNQEITSKEEYISCEVKLNNCETEFTFENKKANIRGRGNSSWWWFDKKPYRLKFEEKVDLFGNGKAKTWTLIANSVDNSMIRNYLAYNIGASFNDLKYTTSTQFVDLYLNGQYRGVYLVCEQVQTGTNRVDIEESLDSVDTGYLLELDGNIIDEGGVENIDYIVCENKTFSIKTPDTEDDDYNIEYSNYIKNYLNQCFDYLRGEDYSLVTEVIEVNSFADSYIVNELLKNADVNTTSFYIYKDAGGKLSSGPIWDYDASIGNAPSSNSKFNKVDNIVATDNIFYNYLIEFDEFKNLVSTKLENYYNKIKNLINEKCDFVLTNYMKSFDRNYSLWSRFETNLKSQGSCVEDIEYVRNWLLESLDYMVGYYC